MTSSNIGQNSSIIKSGNYSNVYFIKNVVTTVDNTDISNDNDFTNCGELVPFQELTCANGSKRQTNIGGCVPCQLEGGLMPNQFNIKCNNNQIGYVDNLGFLNCNALGGGNEVIPVGASYIIEKNGFLIQTETLDVRQNSSAYIVIFFVGNPKNIIVKDNQNNTYQPIDTELANTYLYYVNNLSESLNYIVTAESTITRMESLSFIELRGPSSIDSLTTYFQGTSTDDSISLPITIANESEGRKTILIFAFSYDFNGESIEFDQPNFVFYLLEEVNNDDNDDNDNVYTTYGGYLPEEGIFNINFTIPNFSYKIIVLSVN